MIQQENPLPKTIGGGFSLFIAILLLQWIQRMFCAAWGPRSMEVSRSARDDFRIVYKVLPTKYAQRKVTQIQQILWMHEIVPVLLGDEIVVLALRAGTADDNQRWEAVYNIREA
ncbi:MAG: hypothetical protein ACOYJG_08175 [Prevotella sp.]|jgi:hypothetical protein